MAGFGASFDITVFYHTGEGDYPSSSQWGTFLSGIGAGTSLGSPTSDGPIQVDGFEFLQANYITGGKKFTLTSTSESGLNNHVCPATGPWGSSSGTCPCAGWACAHVNVGPHGIIGPSLFQAACSAFGQIMAPPSITAKSNSLTMSMMSLSVDAGVAPVMEKTAMIGKSASLSPQPEYIFKAQNRMSFRRSARAPSFRRF
jgi:hypothetical protein